MKYPVSLVTMWMRRMSDEPRWWADAYEKAVERIEDKTDAEDPYWYSADSEYDATTDGKVNDPFGGHATPEETRQFAFELLVLADLAEFGGGR
jgi:hypothetical protein